MLISEGGNPRDNFPKGSSKKTSSIEGGGGGSIGGQWTLNAMAL